MNRRTPQAAEQARSAPVSRRYAQALLDACGSNLRPDPPADPPHPAIDWARSGSMALTGQADGPPLLAPGPLAHCAREALLALNTLAAHTVAGFAAHTVAGFAAHAVAGSPSDAELAQLRAIDGPALLGERAAIAGLRRRGRVSPGGSCRLLRAADGWLAVNLARPEDEALVPAWLEDAPRRGESIWRFVSRGLATRDAAQHVARARLMGMPVAPACRPRARPPAWLRIQRIAHAQARSRAARPLVLDLSSLWAGPLCTHLLELAGARVIKLESTRRPDGARRGPADFFDQLNARKSSVALDFTSAGDRELLSRLIERADIVVESARPRALAQLGVAAETSVARRPGLTWLSITGYGRREPQANWAAFGDDAAAAAGLAALTGPPSARPLFCGDAIADPLAGMHAAVAALASFQNGGGVLLDIALRDVAEHALGWRVAPVGGRDDSGAGQTPARVVPDPDDGPAGALRYRVIAAEQEQPVLEPRSRALTARARALGADTASVLRELLDTP